MMSADPKSINNALKNTPAHSKNTTLPFLADFCEQHLLDEKILIVPSYQTGHQIGEALTKAGHSWANLRFATLPPQKFARHFINKKKDTEIHLLLSEYEKLLCFLFLTEFCLPDRYNHLALSSFGSGLAGYRAADRELAGCQSRHGQSGRELKIRIADKSTWPIRSNISVKKIQPL